jgi:predicted aldo/keto reductase-like oxidoreductase
MLPASEDINDLFKDQYNVELKGIAPEREELYQICERENVGITVMKGYAGGRLFSAENSPFGVALTPVQCLHYALTRPAVASIMVGCSTPDEVDAAVAYEDATEDQKDYATVLANAPYHAYSGQCTYCGHCAPCPSYIDIAMVNKLYDLAVMQDDIPATVKAHYQGLSANASDCISCAACEIRCPFGVPIVERMEKAVQLFA